MLLWQQDLFDTSLDLLIPVVHEEKTRTCKSKGRAKKTHGGLLPWLFPEDFPELQEQIEATQFSWSDEDIKTICSGLLSESLYCLIRPKAGNAVRDDVLEWLKSNRRAPFSFSHVCIELNLNAERLRGAIYIEMSYLRGRLNRRRDLSLRETVLRDWLRDQSWLADIESDIPIEMQPGHYDPVTIFVHYLKEQERLAYY